MSPVRSLLAGLIAALAGTVATSQAAPLFRYVPQAKSTRAPPLAVSPFAIAVEAAVVREAGPGGTLEAPLPGGRSASVVIERTEEHANGDLSWFGRVLDPSRDDLKAVGTSGGAGTYAEIETAQGTWAIAPGEGQDWLFDKSEAQLRMQPPARLDDVRIPPPDFTRRPKATCPGVASMPSPQVTVDVLAVTTPDFIAVHGGGAGAETRLNHIFASLNAYNASSNIAVTYRRVATMSAAYPAASAPGDDDGDALDAITRGQGVFANVAAIRNFYGADLVALFRGPKNAAGTSIAGIAWLTGDGNGNLPASHAAYAYSVSGDWTFPSATLPAHELAHNMGNAHDRPNATNVGSTTHSYGHFVCGSGASATCGQAGFNHTGTGFGTIMAYHLPTVAKFSSPNLGCRGTQPGALIAPCGVENQQDVVRATNCVRHSVGAFRASWVGTCADPRRDSDNDGIPDCIEAPSGRVNGVRDNDVFGNALLFSAQQYRDFLGREPDADGLNFWTRSLATGSHTRPQMAEGFFNSEEFQGFIAPVARLYFAYFLRIPDYAGLQHWIGQYRSGISLQQISQIFAASDEFRIRYGSLTNRQFVTLVYNNVLARAPDPAGLAHWTGQLDSGAMTRGQVMLAFSEGAEFRGLSASEVYVTMMYVGMLRRSPDPDGFRHWVGFLDTGSAGLSLIGGFIASAEYRGRFL